MRDQKSITPVLLGLSNSKSAIGCDKASIADRTWNSDYNVSFLMSENSGPILHKLRLALVERDKASGEVQSWEKLTESEKSAKIYDNVNDSELNANLDLIHDGFDSVNLKVRFDVTWEDGFGKEHKTPCCFFEGKTKSGKKVIFGGPIEKVDDKLENLDFFAKFAGQSIDGGVVKKDNHIISSCQGGYSRSVATLALIRMGLGYTVVKKTKEGRRLEKGSAKETFEAMVYNIVKRRWIDANPKLAVACDKVKGRDKPDALTREGAKKFANAIKHCISGAFIAKSSSIMSETDKGNLLKKGQVIDDVLATREKVYNGAEKIIEEGFPQYSIPSPQLPLNQTSASGAGSSKENSPTHKRHGISLFGTTPLSEKKTAAISEKTAIEKMDQALKEGFEFLGSKMGFSEEKKLFAKIQNDIDYYKSENPGEDALLSLLDSVNMRIKNIKDIVVLKEEQALYHLPQNGQSSSAMPSSAMKSSHTKEKMPHNKEHNNSNMSPPLPARRQRINNSGPAPELPPR